MGTVASNALSHGTGESFERPSPYAGLRVGTDVVAINDPERRVQRVPTSERLSAWLRVTRRAMSNRGENFSLRDQIGRKTSWCRRSNGSY